MASLDSLSDELLAAVLSRVPQKQTLTSLPLVCRWGSAAGWIGQNACYSCIYVRRVLPCRRFRGVLLQPTKVWECLDNGFAAAFWRPEGAQPLLDPCPCLCPGAFNHSLTCALQAKAEA